VKNPIRWTRRRYADSSGTRRSSNCRTVPVEAREVRAAHREPRVVHRLPFVPAIVMWPVMVSPPGRRQHLPPTSRNDSRCPSVEGTPQARFCPSPPGATHKRPLRTLAIAARELKRRGREANQLCPCCREAAGLPAPKTRSAARARSSLSRPRKSQRFEKKSPGAAATCSSLTRRWPGENNYVRVVLPPRGN